MSKRHPHLLIEDNIYSGNQILLYTGRSIVGYSFKTGAWKYWYDNGNLMAEGIYEPTQVEEITNCDSDTVNISTATTNWNYFDHSGIKMNNGEAIISKINNSH